MDNEPQTTDLGDRFDATSKEDMEALALRIVQIPREAHGAFSARVLASCLLVAGDQGLKSMEVNVEAAVETIEGMTHYKAWLAALEHPTMAGVKHELVTASARVMTQGTHHDEQWAGAFDQEQIDIFAAIVGSIMKAMEG